MSAISLLIGGGDDVGWGIAAARVRAVLDGDDPAGGGAGALDAAALLGSAPQEGGRRVLVLDTAAGPVPLRVSGRLELRSIEEEQVLVLPQALLGRRAAVFCGVVFEDDRAPLLVFDADRLGGRGGR
jgi:hypothetical protein